MLPAMCLVTRPTHAQKTFLASNFDPTSRTNLRGNRAVFYLVQDTCTRKNLAQESVSHVQVSIVPVHVHKFLEHVSCALVSRFGCN